MQSNITIYYDSLTEATWFQNLNPIFQNAKLELIKTRGKNLPIVDSIQQYDKPDIIVLFNNVPVLVLEKTSEVPTGHNVGQRFARLVRSIELGIPTIYFFPFDAKKHGAYAGICNLNIRLLEASFKIFAIHNTPLLSVNWPSDSKGELITNGSENTVLIQLLSNYIKNNFNQNCPAFSNHYQWMQKEYKVRLDKWQSYGKFPNSVQKTSTNSFCKTNNISSPPPTFLNRTHTYIYKIGMNPKACKRQDPYTGTQFIYDYIKCRNGIKVANKYNNLVLYFPNLDQKTWFANNPNNLTQKSSNWYLTANALLFKDNIFFNIP